MGKGNRERTLRAQDEIQRPQSTVQKKQTPGWVGTAVVILVIAVIVLSLVISSVYNSGMTLRMTDALSTENYTVTGTMMSYFFNSEYTEFVNQYSSILSYFQLDTQKSLKAQECTMLGDGSTWYDYFMDAATASAKQYLVYCEAAKARGLALEDSDMEQIDAAIEAMGEAGAQYGYSTKAYIAAMYGTGVNERDIRNCMELVLLASKAMNDANDEFKAAITDEEIAAYFDENPEMFLKADYLVKSFTAKMEEIDAEDYATIEEHEAALAAAEEAYAAKKAEAHDKAAAYESLADHKSFLDKLTADITEEWDGYYDENSSLSAEEKEAKEKTAIAEDLDEATVEGYAYADPTAEGAIELDKWLFDEARKSGDIYMIEDEDEEAGTYTVYVYCVTATKYREEYTTANISYALIDATAEGAEDNAIALRDALVAGGDLTATAFETLVGNEDYGIGTAGELSNVIKGYFNYDEADEFLFGTQRAVGDCEVVKLGEEYIAVFLYTGDGDAAWTATAKGGVLSEKNTAWLEELLETYTVEVNEKALTKVSA